MPKSLDKETAANLDALNCRVVFDVKITSKRGENGKAIIDINRMTEDEKVWMAILISTANNQPWISASGSDQESALAAVLELAAKSERPRNTPSEMQSQLDETNRKLAIAEAELARLRETQRSGSIDPRGSDTQERREPETKPGKPGKPGKSTTQPITVG